MHISRFRGGARRVWGLGRAIRSYGFNGGDGALVEGNNGFVVGFSCLELGVVGLGLCFESA